MTTVADPLGEEQKARAHITALEQRLAVLESVLSHVNQGISLFNQELCLEFCNQRYLDLLSFPDEFGAPGTPFSRFIGYNAARGEYGPGDPAEQVRLRVEMAGKHQAHRFERTRPADDTTLEIIGTPLENGSFVTTYADISERKRQQRLVEDSQRRLEMALAGADMGLWDWDLQNDQFMPNQRLLAMLGYTETLSASSELLALNVHPDDIEQTRYLLSDHLKGKTPLFEREHRVRNKDDQIWIWLQLRGKVVERDAAGKALRIMGTALDISERKRNEALLLERERRLATLVCSMQDLIFVINTASQISEFWPAPDFDFGLSAEKIIGQEFGSVMPASMVDGLSESIVNILLSGSTPAFEFSLADSQPTVHFQVTMSQLADSGKYATGFLVVVRDITELKQLRQALAQAD